MQRFSRRESSSCFKVGDANVQLIPTRRALDAAFLTYVASLSLHHVNGVSPDEALAPEICVLVDLDLSSIVRETILAKLAGPTSWYGGNR